MPDIQKLPGQPEKTDRQNESRSEEGTHSGLEQPREKYPRKPWMPTRNDDNKVRNNIIKTKADDGEVEKEDQRFTGPTS